LTRDLPRGQVLDAASLEAVPREAVTRHPIHAEPSTRTLLPSAAMNNHREAGKAMTTNHHRPARTGSRNRQRETS
jgi:hypothetical protein